MSGFFVRRIFDTIMGICYNYCVRKESYLVNYIIGVTMFNKELAVLNQDRIGLKGMTLAGNINDKVTIIKASHFIFVYAIELAYSVEIVIKTAYGEDSTLNLKKGDELDLVIKTLQAMA